MAMWDITIKNNSGGAVVIEDMGITLANGAAENFAESFSYTQIADSDDLRTLVTAGTLVVNDGAADLSAADGTFRLTIHNIEEVRKDHYTKTQLSSGTAGVNVHWDNITNAPSFGAPTWLAPVRFRVTAIAASAPVSPASGDVYVNTTNNPDEYHKWNGVAWVSQGNAADGDRVIDLSTGAELIQVYSTTGDAWTAEAANADNDAAIVDDDGDAKAAQYSYNTTGTTWSKIADVDFGGHLDGAAGKHDASEVDVEGTYTNISGTPTDLETTISAIDTALGATNTNTLDEAYDEGGAGAGRTVTADTGAVVLDASAATNAGLQVTPHATLPTTGLSAGQVAVKDNILYVYDATRTKWLSAQRLTLTFGRKGATRDQYLNFGVGELPSNNAGFRMLRNMTITGISAQLDASGTCTAEIRKNDSATIIASEAVAAALGSQDGAINVDVNVGDYLQSYLESTAKVQDPVVVVELAYRE